MIIDSVPAVLAIPDGVMTDGSPMNESNRYILSWATNEAFEWATF